MRYNGCLFESEAVAVKVRRCLRWYSQTVIPYIHPILLGSFSCASNLNEQERIHCALKDVAILQESFGRSPVLVAQESAMSAGTLDW